MESRTMKDTGYRNEKQTCNAGSTALKKRWIFTLECHLRPFEELQQVFREHTFSYIFIHLFALFIFNWLLARISNQPWSVSLNAPRAILEVRKKVAVDATAVWVWFSPDEFVWPRHSPVVGPAVKVKTAQSLSDMQFRWHSSGVRASRDQSRCWW